jgi:hypothetical protein
LVFDEIRPTLQHMLGGRDDISRGCKASPLKSLCTIKDSGDYRAGWMVLGNLDGFEGETFASTASKKVPWLLYAVFIILGLRCHFSTAERPTRPVYVTIKGEYLLIIATLFHDGLAGHLQAGDYHQSQWDRINICLLNEKLKISCD